MKELRDKVVSAARSLDDYRKENSAALGEVGSTFKNLEQAKMLEEVAPRYNKGKAAERRKKAESAHESAKARMYMQKTHGGND